jgi:hypothetical protein
MPIYRLGFSMNLSLQLWSKYERWLWFHILLFYSAITHQQCDYFTPSYVDLGNNFLGDIQHAQKIRCYRKTSKINTRIHIKIKSRDNGSWRHHMAKNMKRDEKHPYNIWKETHTITSIIQYHFSTFRFANNKMNGSKSQLSW